MKSFECYDEEGSGARCHPMVSAFSMMRKLVSHQNISRDTRRCLSPLRSPYHVFDEEDVFEYLQSAVSNAVPITHLC